MKFIKLTSVSDNSPIIINAECIGHMYQVKATIEYGREKEPAHTRVGVTNGGFRIAEDIDQIVKLIEKSK